MHATDADEMTPRQRLDEIADILATGLLRLHRWPGHVPEAGPDEPQPPENTFPDSPELTGCPAAPSA